MDYFTISSSPHPRSITMTSKAFASTETLKTPFSGALVDYAEEGNQLWTCPRKIMLKQ